MRQTYLIAGALAVLAGCTPEPESPTATSPPPATPPAAAPAARPAANAVVAVITAERGGFIPEGIEYDEDNGRFLSGSLAEGTIFVIERDGRVVPFIRDSELVSSVGIEADESHDRLLVTNSNSAVFNDQSATGHAKLGVYHLTTGEKLAMVDLGATIGAGARHFANDVTVDGEGNAYVTDTFANAIYRVTPAYQATVMHRFTDLPPGVQLNGIVYHDGGYLLAVAEERIYKVPVANPVRLGEAQHILFLTGPNMAGKTTYLRSCGVALYLAHVGMSVPAKSFRFSPCERMFSSINVTDDLRGGVSYFRATDPFPLETADHNKLHEFYARLAAGRLSTTRCTACHRSAWPPRGFCPECASDRFEWVDLPGEGSIHAFTVPHSTAAVTISDSTAAPRPMQSSRPSSSFSRPSRFFSATFSA